MQDLPITRIEAFFRGLHRRVPRGGDDASQAVRGRIEKQLGRLNATMLGRDFDERVPVDIDDMALTIADRMARYTSGDWSRNNVIDHARAAVDAIAVDLRGSATDDDVDAWGDPVD